MNIEPNVETKLLDFICRNFMVERGAFSLDESLVDQGVIDSFGLVEIVAFIEREFGVAIAEADMNRHNFGSARKIVSFIATLQAR